MSAAPTPPSPVAAATGDAAAIAANLTPYRPADAAEAINRLERSTAAKVVEAMPASAAICVFGEPHLDEPAKLVAQMAPERAGAILRGLHADRRANIFRHLPEPMRQDLAARLDPAMRDTLDRQLGYPEHSAGEIMTTEFLGVPTNWTVAQTLARIREIGDGKEEVYTVCLLDPETRRLVQVISLRRLVISDPAANVLSAARPHKPIKVGLMTDREEVARLISKYDLLAIPVVADDDHVLGIVTVDDVMDAITEEGTEDVQKFGGSEALDEPYMKIDFKTMIRKRGGWLCALFLSEMLTASAMQHYQGEIEKAIVLSLFIPLIMSSGGNSGSQATSLIIRALALREIALSDWWRIAVRELPAGMVLGAILGVIGMVRVTIWQVAGFYDYGKTWPLVALTIGLALTAIVTFGSLVGAMLPFVLKRFGFDPATASAPFVATLVDVTGIVIYFSVAYVVLQGTLL